MPTAEAVTSIADAASDASAEASALIARPFAVRRFLRVAERPSGSPGNSRSAARGPAAFSRSSS